jgi:acyl-CoA reductase-like NAD-dependent aldehyde dehydrogenase
LLKVSDFNHFLGGYINTKCREVFGFNNLINDAFINPSQLTTVREFRPIKKLIFSGSRTSARRIFEVLAEKRFIDCNLFYGGQEAAYVDETADLQLAADELCKNAFYNNGQSYECIRHLYAHSHIVDKLIELVANGIEKLKIGDPKLTDTDLGPITVQESVVNYEQLVMTI